VIPLEVPWGGGRKSLAGADAYPEPAGVPLGRAALRSDCRDAVGPGRIHFTIDENGRALKFNRDQT
jgi:hypothetical protein